MMIWKFWEIRGLRLRLPCALPSERLREHFLPFVSQQSVTGGGHIPSKTLLDVCAVQMLTRIVNGNVYEKRMKIQFPRRHLQKQKEI